MLDAHGLTPPVHAILGRTSIVCCPCEQAQWDVGLHSERAALHDKNPAQEDRLGRCNHLHRAAWDPMAAEHQRLSTMCVQAEDAVQAQGFPRVTIFRPGLLLKSEKATVMEKVIGSVLTGIPVKDVARCMRLDAEATGSSGKIISMADMLKTAQAAKQ